MNLAVTTTNGKTLMAVKIRSLVTVAAAALILTTLAGAAAFNAIEGHAENVAAPVQPSFRMSPGLVPSQPVMTHYLVGSEAQRQAIEAEAAWQRNDNIEYNSNPQWKYTVILMSGVPEEDEEILRLLEAERARWQAIGASGFEVVDLRRPEPSSSVSVQDLPVFIYLVESQSRANNIMAGVGEEQADVESRGAYSDSHAFKVTTPEEEAWVADFVETLAGRDVKVMDIRQATIE